jgi:hypothetical protein
MANIQTRTAAKKKMVSGVSSFAWATSAQAKKIGLVKDGEKYFLGDLRLTAQNFSTILTQLKMLGRVIARGRSAVH